MGAKQSKRSVDISGKEAEGGGEVAAAGAGGEGRMEPLADADALKPQLNGDAHIQHEQTDKEKELDSGTPENEKDATTEKEAKEGDDNDKEVAVTNGETEPKVENGESTPTPEDGKKPKKEKVKKKWSLRSISFSRKDKPKQEKKQKEEEPKTNGEPEKVPEETAEATPEAAANEIAEEVISPVEDKEEKIPETPVTEPLTNGTSTPDSVKAETPATEEAAPAPSPEADRPADVKPDPAPEPEQLPVNGLSLEESKPETPEVEKPEETKPEPPPVAETVEIVPAPEIPKEVCVEQMPLLEPTPPPLPANPPPSSVASFAATTMAPELTDASLANTADAAIAPLSALSETKDILDQPEPCTTVTVTETLENEIPSVLKETSEDIPAATINNEPEIKSDTLEETVVTDLNVKVEIVPEIDIVETVANENSEVVEITCTEIPETVLNDTIVTEPSATMTDPTQAASLENVISEPLVIETAKIETSNAAPVIIEAEIKPDVNQTTLIESINVDEKAETLTQAVEESVITESAAQIENTPESEMEISEGDDSSLPPPPLQDEDDCVTNLDEVDEKVEESLKQIPEPIIETKEDLIEVDHISTNEMTNGVHDISPDEAVDAEMLKKKAKAALACAAETKESNGSAADVAEAAAEKEAGEEAPLQNGSALAQPPAAAPHTPQEPLPVSDKLADLIPEVPDVPELNTDTLQETATDVAVAN